MWLCVIRPTVSKLRYCNAFRDSTKQSLLAILLSGILTNILCPNLFSNGLMLLNWKGNTDVCFFLSFLSHDNLFFPVTYNKRNPLKLNNYLLDCIAVICTEILTCCNEYVETDLFKEHRGVTHPSTLTSDVKCTVRSAACLSSLDPRCTSCHHKSLSLISWPPRKWPAISRVVCGHIPACSTFVKLCYLYHKIIFFYLA